MDGSSIFVVNKGIGWITPRAYSDSVVLPSQHYEIFCTIDWPVVIAARVTNISVNLEINSYNGIIPMWPNVTRVNETMIRFCVEKGHTVESSTATKYGCYLTITKTTLQNTRHKGAIGWSQKSEFDKRFQNECTNELSRGDSNFHYLLANESKSHSVCSEGLRRIKNNGYLQLLENLTSISAMSKNDYEFITIGFDAVNVEEDDIWKKSILSPCESYALKSNRCVIL